ncbi:hypothetical protein B0H34DRAFT_679489 [Crassisporium funariophilum]|nr:hypothetical protein B0H34DRAFT_679489 [Crassisporium funariophilum]
MSRYLRFLSPEGFEYQSQDLNRKHLKSYGDSREPQVKAVESISKQGSNLSVSGHGQDPKDQSIQTPGASSAQPDDTAPISLAESELFVHHELFAVDETLDWEAWKASNDDYDGNNDQMLEVPQSRAPSPQMPMQAPTVNPGDQVWQPVCQIDISTPGSDVDNNNRPALTPPAFRKKPHIRMTYLQAVINNVYANIPVQQTTDIMNNTLNAFSVAGVLLPYPRPVQTLESAKRRLGLDADQHITQYAICPKCWKHYTPKQILQADSSDCLVPGCNGKIYEEYTNRKLAGRMK